MTKILGSHTSGSVRKSGEARTTTISRTAPQAGSPLTALMTAANPFATAGTGNGFASFLLGYGNGGGVNQNAFVAAQIIYSAFYVGDQWRSARSSR